MANNSFTGSREVMLEATGITVKRADHVVLEIPALTVGRGEVLCLIGPNGAGKTTMLETLACLLKPSAGTLTFRGLSVGKDISLLDYRRRLAMVFQDPLLFDSTVFKNVATGLRIRRVDKSEIERRVFRELKRFNVEGLAARSARRLSGGEAQRVSLARALATDPEILFLDEPFSALDPWTRGALIVDLEALLREQRITTVITTHSLDEALRLADRIALVIKGRIVFTATTEETLANPPPELKSLLDVRRRQAACTE
jgi:tungstate transport system ATP-binding protein